MLEYGLMFRNQRFPKKCFSMRRVSDMDIHIPYVLLKSSVSIKLLHCVSTVSDDMGVVLILDRFRYPKTLSDPLPRSRRSISGPRWGNSKYNTTWTWVYIFFKHSMVFTSYLFCSTINSDTSLFQREYWGIFPFKTSLGVVVSTIVDG